MKLVWLILSIGIVIANSQAYSATLCHGKVCISVDISDTATTRQMGLMYRQSLADSHGMLFMFPREKKYRFWMKNMRIPLDIVWLDTQWTVVDTHINVEPCQQSPCPQYSPRLPARYVLEINADDINRYNIIRGSRWVLER